jgi:hypothetical protein
MKRFAHSLKSALLLTTFALAGEHAQAQTTAPPSPLIPRTVFPSATTDPAAVAATAFAPRCALTFADLQAQFPQNNDGCFLMEVPSIVNTSTDTEAQALLSGQQVVTTGQVMVETGENAAGQSLRITQSQFQCCSAHARQFSVALEFAGAIPAMKEGTWVRLTGTLAYRDEGGKTAPFILVKQLAEISKPTAATL